MNESNCRPRPHDPDSAAVGWPASGGLPALPAGARVHLVGIGGAGMSGLARVMAQRGLVVSGSDRAGSQTVRRLQWLGISVTVGHAAENLPPDCALVVRSPAVPDDNPEVAEARVRGVPVTKRAVLLGGLVDSSLGVAVAGTHGKTTTSGLLAWICVSAGLDPTVFVGGHVPDLGANARSGSGRHVVLEADEYDRSFQSGHAWLAVVLDVELDHPDIYPDLAAVRDAFREFVANVRPDGLVILGAGSAGAGFLAGSASVPVETFGLADDPELGDSGADWTVSERLPSGSGQRLAVVHRGASLGWFETRLPGRHNAANCLAAVAAASAMAVPLETVRAAVASYSGVGRRFELVGSAAGVVVVDDYAHHPTEIRATVAAARERYPGRRLWAVLEPHTFSRVAALGPAFAGALADVDRAVITPIYAAREQPLADVGPLGIARAVPGAVAVDSLAAAERLVASEARPGDVALFLGAGDAPSASRGCLRRLARRAVAQLLDDECTAGGLTGSAEPNASLAPYTTLRVGGPADLLVLANDLEALGAWWSAALRHDVPVTVLGRGSNVVVQDGGVPGMVLINRCKRWHVEADDGQGHLVAESGTPLAGVARAVAREGWRGLEAGAGIPGSLGGAVIGNAGAFGWSMADCVERVEVLGPEGQAVLLTPGDLGFRYRGSALRGGQPPALLTKVWLRLERDQAEEVRSRIDDFLARRRATQPTGSTAGSVFRNPPGDHAGRLLEAAGVKGATLGGAQVSPVHANFIVNLGDATAADVLGLVERMRQAVKERSDVLLELEIGVLGVDDA